MFREIKRINPIPYNNFVILERMRKQAPRDNYFELKNVDLTNFRNNFGRSLKQRNIDQIKDMFREVTNLDKAHWKANFAKNKGKTFNIEINGQTHTITPTNPAEFKNALNTLWKKAFIDNADFFDIIWANQNLRGSLFGDIINNAPDIQTAKALSQTNFTQLINTEADELFKFIKVE